MTGMAVSETLTPPVVWAQRTGVLYVTIRLSDISDEKVSFDENKLVFEGFGGKDKKLYSVTLEFLKEIVPEESSQKKSGSELAFILKKKVDEPYWDRLLKQSGKHHFLKVDFNKWRDEDDVDTENNDAPAGNPDFSSVSDFFIPFLHFHVSFG
eukprot:Sdes_comp18084_c0_seq4m7505